MASQALATFTEEEYLAREREAEFKSEYFAGEIFAMAGASERHNLIVVNLVRELGLQLKGKPCKLFAGDMRVKVSETGLYTYPDLAAVCGEARYGDEHRDVLLNPMLIVEVLSDSTESYDRGQKFEHYRCLDSLEEYVLVAQNRCHVDRYLRQDDRWLLDDRSDPAEILELTSIGARLPLSEIYYLIELENAGISPA